MSEPVEKLPAPIIRARKHRVGRKNAVGVSVVRAKDKAIMVALKVLRTERPVTR